VSSIYRCCDCYTVITLSPDQLDESGCLAPFNLNGKRHFCFDIVKNSDSVTPDRLKDELFLNMIRVQYSEPKSGAIKRKYEDQARSLMSKIPVYKPTPYFVLYYSDILDDKIRQELAALDRVELNGVMRAAIGRVFECVDERQFNLSVRNLLRWRIEA
jgi:hypothetical protein